MNLSASSRLDLSAIVGAIWQSAIMWGAAVAMVTLSGYPGVVCCTPAAWLLGCLVGPTCVSQTRSQSAATRATEAGIAGGILGFLEGVIFALVIAFGGETQLEEQANVIVLSVGMIVVGTLVTAGLSVVVAAIQDRRMRPAGR